MDCNNGDWWNDKVNKYLYVCFSGKGKKQFEYVDINAIRCEGNSCPEGVKEEPLEMIKRHWSNASNWPNGVKPKEGDIVTIPANWDLILDESTPILEELVINGHLTFDDTKTDLNL